MNKGICIKNIHTFKDLGFMLAKRNISIPKPNRITEKVPYQNGEYDFSNLNGEITYQNRTLSYTFDIAEIDTKEMELQKRIILNWAANVINEEIYDDYIEGYHFVGSYNSSSWNEDFGQGEITIEFSVYPYLYADTETVKSFIIEEETSIVLNTESSHRIIPTINTTGNFLISTDNGTIAIGEGSFKDVNFFLDQNNIFQITGNGTISFTYVDEVL